MANKGVAGDPQDYEAILAGRVPVMLSPSEVEPGDVIHSEAWLKQIARKDERTDDMTVLWFIEGPWSSLCIVMRDRQKWLYLRRSTDDG